MTHWLNDVPAYEGDPILSLMEVYAQDTRLDKANLSIGMYYNEDGKVPVLSSVAEVARRFSELPPSPCVYLPMEGLPDYREQIQNLLFAERPHVLASKQVATIQTLGGTGALKVGADFLKHFLPDAHAWVSTPTWDNHITIFEGAGIPVHRYPYFDPQTGGVDFDALCSTLDTLPAQSIVILHPCCHNPTGADLTPEQWDTVIAILQRRELVPFMDCAYQGFAKGLNEDFYSIHRLIDTEIPFLISHSFSKIFSLYGERCGSLSIVTHTAQQAERVLGQCKQIVRRIYSMPPSTGARWIAAVLGDQALNTSWKAELENMRLRMQEMRQTLKDNLQQRQPSHDFSYLVKQEGMFSYTGLTSQQVARLQTEFGVYLLRSGRLCVAGLNHHNIQKVSDAIAAVLAV